jgi:excisionase family DNA binding protein
MGSSPKGRPRKLGARPAAPTLTRERAVEQPVPAAPARLAYRVEEACTLLGVCRRTIERAIADGRLKSSKRLGVRLIDARSVEVMFDDTSEG